MVVDDQPNGKESCSESWPDYHRNALIVTPFSLRAINRDIRDCRLERKSASAEQSAIYYLSYTGVRPCVSCEQFDYCLDIFHCIDAMPCICSSCDTLGFVEKYSSIIRKADKRHNVEVGGVFDGRAALTGMCWTTESAKGAECSDSTVFQYCNWWVKLP